MAQQVLDIIAEYGLETAILALVINLLTALIKWPIKKLASKTKHCAQITRFIVFLPIVLGFAASSLYIKFFSHGAVLGKECITLWLTSSSLSLTFYAVFEKLLPPKARESSAAETEECREVLDALSEAAGINTKNDKGEENDEKTAEEVSDETSAQSSRNQIEKIILRGKNDKTA